MLLSSPLLAHGALGPWDELIFLAVGVIFLVMMGLSWFRSRRLPDEGYEHERAEMDRREAADDDRFELD